MAVIIPVLDLSLTDKNFQETSALLVRHLSDIGFVYLSGHGIANNVIESCRKSSRAFFNSTEEEKLKFCYKSIEKNTGYKAFESERLNPKQIVKDAREAFNLDGHDVASNDWPSEDMKENVSPLILDMGQLCHKVLHMIGQGLGLKNPKQLMEAHSFQSGITSKSSITTLRINHYPKLSQLKAEQVQCGEHADFGSVTLLIQDHVPGLEVQTIRNGAFVPATPLPGTVLLNIGLLLENWTNGKLRATRHRVIQPMNEVRMSIVLFAQPDNDVMVQPLLEMRQGQIDYEEVSAQEFCLQLIADIQ